MRLSSKLFLSKHFAIVVDSLGFSALCEYRRHFLEKKRIFSQFFVLRHVFAAVDLDGFLLFPAKKRLNYESRIINVEKSTFNALVFACSDGPGPYDTKVK